MGLDCIPREYPCKRQGTAVLDDEGKIMCDTTQECGGCPWKKDYEANPFIGNPTYGMFGTGCWYRGKSGNVLLDNHVQATDRAAPSDFYGDDNVEDEATMSPQGAVDLGEWMANEIEHVAKRARVQHGSYLKQWRHGFDDLPKEYRSEDHHMPYSIERYVELTVRQWAYAAWWAKWAGENCDGWTAWY